MVPAVAVAVAEVAEVEVHQAAEVVRHPGEAQRLPARRKAVDPRLEGLRPVDRAKPEQMVTREPRIRRRLANLHRSLRWSLQATPRPSLIPRSSPVWRSRFRSSVITSKYSGRRLRTTIALPIR